MIKKNIFGFFEIKSWIYRHYERYSRKNCDRQKKWEESKNHTQFPLHLKKTCFKFFLHYVAQTSVVFCSSFFFLCFVISKEKGLQLAIFFPFVATSVHKVIFGQKLVSLLGPSTSIFIVNRGRLFQINLM